MSHAFLHTCRNVIYHVQHANLSWLCCTINHVVSGGNPKQSAVTFNWMAGGISFYILSQGADIYNLITTPFMPEHFRTFPIRAAARRHSAAHTSLSWCHSLLSDGLEMKGGGRGGQAGMTIQESSWLMGVSRCQVRGGSGRESWKSICCLHLCATATVYVPRAIRLEVYLNMMALWASDFTFSSFKQFNSLHWRRRAQEGSPGFDMCTAGCWLIQICDFLLTILTPKYAAINWCQGAFSQCWLTNTNNRLSSFESFSLSPQLLSSFCMSQLVFSYHSSIVSLPFFSSPCVLGERMVVSKDEQWWVNLFHMESKNGIGVVLPQLLFWSQWGHLKSEETKCAYRRARTANLMTDFCC